MRFQNNQLGGIMSKGTQAKRNSVPATILGVMATVDEIPRSHDIVVKELGWFGLRC